MKESKYLQYPIGLFIVTMVILSGCVAAVMPTPTPAHTETAAPTRSPMPTITPEPTATPYPIPQGKILFIGRSGQDDGNSIYSYTFSTGEVEELHALPKTMTPGDGDVSPDHRSIVFTMTEDYTHYTYLFIFSLNTLYLRQITFNDHQYSSPHWSADGSYILLNYASSTTDKLDIYRIQPDGSQLELVLTLPGNQYGPDISPDGERIVFSSYETYGTNIDLFIYNADGSIEQLTDDEWFETRPIWSPDGESILFHSDREGDINLYEILLSDLMIRKIGDLIPEDPYIYNVSGVWSPDGQFVAFMTTRNNDRQLFIIQKDGSNARLLIGDLRISCILGWIP